MTDRSDGPAPPKRRQQTPRMPSNTLYNRIVPIAIGLLLLILLGVIVAVVFGAGAGY